jgi:hypothetical protein
MYRPVEYMLAGMGISTSYLLVTQVEIIVVTSIRKMLFINQNLKTINEVKQCFYLIRTSQHEAGRAYPY